MVEKIAGAAVQGANEIAKAPKVESFGKVMEGAQKPAAKAALPHAPEQARMQNAAAPAKVQSLQAKPHAAPVGQAQRAQLRSPVEAKPKAAALLNEVAGAQAKLDQILKMAESGRTFSPAELLAFQAHAYRASQELDLAGKVVEKATSGVKQTLNTQV